MAGSPVEISPERLTGIRDLYHRGLFLQAFRVAQEVGPLGTWQGPEAMLMAGRLAGQVGGGVLSQWLIRRAWQQAPGHEQARYYYAFYVARARGPYAAWRFMHEAGDPPDSRAAKRRAEWFALRAHLAATLRDFDTADIWLERAIALTPQWAWVRTCQATVLELEDRYEGALAAARAAMDATPWYCPAVQSAAHLLTLLDRDAQAVELLAEAAEHVESVSVVGQLSGLLFELHDYHGAGAALDRCPELAPLGDRSFRRWLAAQRSEVAYHLGDVPAAIRHAKEVGREFFTTIAARLEDAGRAAARSVVLPVGFVRQHHVTCAPATLSAISRFWSQPADHLQVVDEICYDGTTAYNERQWAERHGWATREFTVTEPSAKALLDRGVPFTFATVNPGNAHLQAVIGYDGRRGTLWIRDPFWRNAREAIGDKLLEQYRAYGPRGMALVPERERVRLDGLDLPDAAQWDRLHGLDGALVRHCREEAATICAELSGAADGCRLGWEARRRLACYDANPTQRLAAVEQLLRAVPQDPCLQLERLSCLRDLARRDERLAIYEEICGKRDVHPVFLQQYAQELRADARRRGEAVALLRRAVRRAPLEPGGYYVLAHVLWDQRQFDEALGLYRFATCINDKEEDFANSYFIAAQWFKRTEEAFAFLRGRLERFGAKSSLPARTLTNAYLRWNRTAEALATVEAAMRLRPEDGQLQLFAADTLLSCSTENMPRALELLERSRGASPLGHWLRTAARLAAVDARPADALKLWQELLEIQPLATDAHEVAARLLAETRGRAAALAHLAAAAARFPHYQPLQRLQVQWVREEPAEVREPLLRRAAAALPHDAWLHRELAFFLEAEHRLPEACQEADLAGRLEPDSPSYHVIHARLLRDEGRIDEAKDVLRASIRLSVDYDFAIGDLMGLCTTAGQRREVLALVKDELVRQVTFGDGLLAFRNHAHGTLEAEELLAVLRAALEERPDLWHAWSATTRQLLAMDRREEAWALACQTTDRFPLLPPTWLDRAAACRAREDWPGEREALETCCHINPDWGVGVRMLADFLERQGQFDECRRLLEQAVARCPLDVANHGLLAEFLWRRNEREEALARIRRAVELEPGRQQSWTDLNAWATRLGRRAVAREAAEKVTASRPGQSRSWLMLAEALDAPEQLDQRLAALDKALALDPRLIAAHELRAIALAGAGRWEEARQACCGPPWGDHPPRELRACAAWLHRKQGNLAEAIAQLRSLVADEPGFFAAWSRLWDWCRERNDYHGCLEAAEAMVRINPQYEVSLGCLGEAKRLLNDSAGARDAFRRAFEMVPAYEFAGNGLFDLQLAAADLAGAAATMAVLRRHSNSALVSARAVQLAARQGNAAAAADALRQVCVSPSPDPWAVKAAVKAMTDARWGQLARKILEELLPGEQTNLEVGREWARLCTAQKRWGDCGRKLAELAGRSRVGAEAAVVYIEALAKAGQRLRLRWFLWRNQDWLRKNTRCWGSVGYVLNHLHWFKYLLRWLADWRQRNDLEPWILKNLVEGLRRVGRDAEAAEAGRRALALPPDQSHAGHRLWLAADACCQGRIDAARELLQQVEGTNFRPEDKFLRLSALAVVTMASARAEERPLVFRAQRKRLDQAQAQYPGGVRDPARRRFYRRCRRIIAQCRGGLAARLWSWYF
ncbi:MAG: tetratricopeptide repeat protein [Thermoguttaceae bacterium]